MKMASPFLMLLLAKRPLPCLTGKKINIITHSERRMKIWHRLGTAITAM